MLTFPQAQPVRKTTGTDTGSAMICLQKERGAGNPHERRVRHWSLELMLKFLRSSSACDLLVIRYSQQTRSGQVVTQPADHITKNKSRLWLSPLVFLVKLSLFILKKCMTLVCDKTPLPSQSKSLFFLLVTFPGSPQFHHQERKESVQKLKEESGVATISTILLSRVLILLVWNYVEIDFLRSWREARSQLCRCTNTHQTRRDILLFI